MYRSFHFYIENWIVSISIRSDIDFQTCENGSPFFSRVCSGCLHTSRNYTDSNLWIRVAGNRSQEYLDWTQRRIRKRFPSVTFEIERIQESSTEIHLYAARGDLAVRSLHFMYLHIYRVNIITFERILLFQFQRHARLGERRVRI